MANSTEEKLKALQAAMAKIEKSYGHGSIMRLGEENIEKIDSIPTGSIGLNAALGVGGYPKGRIIEIYGPESSGKTTLALHAIAESQKQGGVAAFIDAEHAFDRFYASKLGVNINELLISQPDNGEQALAIADQLISSAAVDIIVIDSVAALTPKAEIEGDMGENKVGLQARLMSQALRKLTATISKTKTTKLKHLLNMPIYGDTTKIKITSQEFLINRKTVPLIIVIGEHKEEYHSIFFVVLRLFIH